MVGRIGKALHAHYDTVTHEPLPERWVDLITHLNEKERSQRKAREAEAEPRRSAPLRGD
jgi:hypothetical protein